MLFAVILKMRLNEWMISMWISSPKTCNCVGNIATALLRTCVYTRLLETWHMYIEKCAGYGVPICLCSYESGIGWSFIKQTDIKLLKQFLVTLCTLFYVKVCIWRSKTPSSHINAVPPTPYVRVITSQSTTQCIMRPRKCCSRPWEVPPTG